MGVGGRNGNLRTKLFVLRTETFSFIFAGTCSKYVYSRFVPGHAFNFTKRTLHFRPAEVAALLAGQAPADAALADGRTALHLAAQHGADRWLDVEMAAGWRKCDAAA